MGATEDITMLITASHNAKTTSINSKETIPCYYFDISGGGRGVWSFGVFLFFVPGGHYTNEDYVFNTEIPTVGGGS